MGNPCLKHGRFFFEDWGSPDPDDGALNEALENLYPPGRNDDEEVVISRDDAYKIHAAACAYLHFAGHPATTKSICQQLAELRAAVNKNRKVTRG